MYQKPIKFGGIIMTNEIVKDYMKLYNVNKEDLISTKNFPNEEDFLNYVEGEYNTDKHWAFEIKKEECALLVIDMEEDFVNPDGKLFIPQANRMVPRLKGVIEACRKLGVPVIYPTHTISKDTSADFYEYWDSIREGAIQEGTEGTKVYSGLEPLPTERVIDAKHAYCSFAGTDLDYVLRNLGVKTIIVSGTLTNFCCESTARSGYFLNYHVVFGSDINATDNALAHEATLRTMRRGFARVMSGEEIIDNLRNGDEIYKKAVAARNKVAIGK